MPRNLFHFSEPQPVHVVAQHIQNGEVPLGGLLFSLYYRAEGKDLHMRWFDMVDCINYYTDAEAKRVVAKLRAVADLIEHTNSHRDTELF